MLEGGVSTCIYWRQAGEGVTTIICLGDMPERDVTTLSVWVSRMLYSQEDFDPKETGFSEDPYPSASFFALPLRLFWVIKKGSRLYFIHECCRLSLLYDIMISYKTQKQWLFHPIVTLTFLTVTGILKGVTFVSHMFIICLDHALRTLIDIIKENGFILKKKSKTKQEADDIPPKLWQMQTTLMIYCFS